MKVLPGLRGGGVDDWLRSPMARVLHSLFLLGLLVSGLHAADATASKAPPRQVELGVYILDITDIDEPGGKFTLHV